MDELSLSGIVAAPYLPLHQDGSIDWAGLERYISWVADQRPAAIAMNMDASEGPSLTRDEQLEVLRVAKVAIGGRVRLFSGLISNSTDDACTWGKTLRTAGGEGFAVFPPFPVFLGAPVPAEMIYRFHAAIAAAVEAPIIAFQFPVAFGPDFPPETLRRLCDIPHFIGLKEASFDTARTIETIEAAAELPRRVSILTGSDTFVFEALMMGADGALIGLAGTATDRLVAMHAAIKARRFEEAHAVWQAIGPLARFAWRKPMRDYRPRMKEVLVMQGLIGSAFCRLPQLPIDDAEREQLRRLAEHAGLLG